jgi:hypothetical protein
MGRQLNIKSDEAFHAAHKIADNLGITTTKAVELALSKMLDQSKIEFPKHRTKEEKHEIYNAITKWAETCTARAKLGATSDHSDMYDEYGLPI